MSGEKTDPQGFFRRAENVALHMPASEVFGVFKRSLDLPGPWAAFVRRDTGDQVFVPAGDVVEGGGAEDILFVRVSPIEVALDEGGLVTGDGYQCHADVRLSLNVIPERSEVSSFLKVVVGSRRVLQAGGLARYVQPALRTALAKVAAARDAADLTEGRWAEAVSNGLEEALKAPLFAGGLTLNGRPSARFGSPTFDQVQAARQQALRQQAEHDAAREVQQALERAQDQHLDHLAELLTRLKALAASSPDVELPVLVRTFSERERGELYGALFASESVTTRTRCVWVAAGDELLAFDPSDLESPYRRFPVTGEAGPVRSIQAVPAPPGGTVLLLGAATGVYRLAVDETRPDLTLTVDGAPAVHGGFNAAVLVGSHVLASHSELGLYEWPVEDGAPGRRRFESLTHPAKAVRGVRLFEGDLYCAIDNRVIRWPADEAEDRAAHVYTGSTTTITALCPAPDGLYAGNGDGDILHWPAGRETAPQRLHTGTHRAAESLWLLSDGGVRRLVYTDTSLHVHVRVVGDNFVCRYEAGGQTLRRVEVAADLLVATNDLRDRLICWAPGRPTTPLATVGVSRLCGRSIQDVCIVTEA